MRLPIIKFVYHQIYDEHWRECVHLFPRIFKKVYPTPKQISNSKKLLEKMWEQDGEKVLKEMSRITGLPWPNKIIPCYIVGNAYAISDPLTIQSEAPDKMFDTLVHELLHHILAIDSSLEKTEKAWSFIFKKYKKESFVTKVHIPVHAIHKHIYLKFFGPTRYKRDIKNCSTAKYYARAWDIVEKDGYENIIKDFKKLIK